MVSFFLNNINMEGCEKEFRCRSCGKLFFKGVLPKDGKIEIKCNRCKEVNVVTGDEQGDSEERECKEINS